MKTGRPKLSVNLDLAKKLCAIFCTANEIADILDVSVDTLERRIQQECNMSFADFFKKHSAHGKMSLRRKQFEVAMKGNVSMLIWLGKQYLGQTEKIENLEADIPQVLEVRVVSDDTKTQST